MPQIGFGTWQIENGDQARAAVAEALAAGYRLIDTAKIYGNEESVGEAFGASGLPREEVFITTKLWNSDHGYANAHAAFEASLRSLGLDYVDLYLIHWPTDDARGRQESWRGLCEIHKQGWAKSIGVSNFTVEHLQGILDISNVVPAVNQILFHPFTYKEQRDLLEFCRQYGIIVQAYSPLARGRDMDHPTITAIAEKYRKSPAQIMLRWAIQHGTVPIPKSSSPERMRENLDIFNFELSAEDIEAMDNLG